VPGGRWLIAGFLDGSIRYIDFEDPPSGDMHPHILVPSPFSEHDASTNRMEMQLSIDFTSDFASSTAPGEYHLVQFNLGVVYSNRFEPMNDSPVRVWRVKVKFETVTDNSGNDHGLMQRRAVGLEAVECLSSFNEHCLLRLYCCHLHGSMIAYSAEWYGEQPVDCIVLVDWTQANCRAKDGGIQRWYGPTLRAVVRFIPFYEYSRALLTVSQAMYLLPEGRILVIPPKADCQIQQLNWQSDWPHSTTIGPEDQNFDRVEPAWSHKFPKTYLFSIMHTPPLFIRDGIRFVVPTRTEVFGVILPISSQPPSKDIHIVSLAKGSWEKTWSFQTFGYRRGISIDRSSLNYHAMDYAWSDEEPTSPESNPMARFISIPYSSIAGIDGELFIDHYSNRIIVAEMKYERWFFIQLPSI
jgi:hypothetical protein